MRYTAEVLSVTRVVRIATVVLLWAGCVVDEPPTTDPEPQPVLDEARGLTNVSVVGDLGYGTTSAPTRYQAPPLYYAFRFQATAGDTVQLQVHSDRSGIQVRLLDANFTILSGTHAEGTDAALGQRLTATGSYYVAFRDAAKHSATFTVTIAANCQPHSCATVGAQCGELSDGCGGTIDCGCSLPATCGGSGVPGTCGSSPSDRLDRISDDQLKTAIHDQTANHTALSYDRARKAMFDAMNGVDVVDGKVTCIYTGRTVMVDGSPTPPDMSIEHAWPQSQGASSEPAKSDLHHLLPVDVRANSARNNHPYGLTHCDEPSQARCLWASGPALLGPSIDDNSTIFQPRPEGRGDAARAKFYFALRYGLAIPPGEEALLREWNEQDPPTAAERHRNDLIEALQHNRNIFVDRPDLVRHIADF